MARITVEDCLEHIDTRFELVLVAARRARQLSNGASTKLAWENDKPTVMALREIAAGQINKSVLDQVSAKEHAEDDYEAEAAKMQEVVAELDQVLPDEAAPAAGDTTPGE